MKTKMQTVMWSLALATGLMVAMPAVQAQDDNGQKPRKERREGGGPGMNIERLKEELGLTDAQVEKLKPILAAQREEIAAKRKELGKDADRQTAMEAMKAIREKYKAQIDAVLTDEQKAKLEKLRERGPRPGGPGGGEGGKGKGKGKGKGGDGDTPPPPPSES